MNKWLSTNYSALSTQSSTFGLLILVASLLPLTASAASANNVTVAKVFGTYSGTLDNSSEPGWVTFSDRPNVWVKMSRMAQAALNVFKAAPPGFFNTLYTTPVDSTTDELYNIGYNNFTTTAKTVSSLTFWGNANQAGPYPISTVAIYDPSAPGAGAGGLVYGRLTTPEQAAIAATAYTKKIPLTYTIGCVYLYNAGSGMVEQLCGVATSLQIN